MTITLPPHIAANIARFTGRTWLLPPLLAWLEETQERLFILTGEPGAGKSSVMAWLAGAGPEPGEMEAKTQRAQLSDWVKAVHFCRAGSGNTAPKAFARSLAEQLTHTVPGFSDTLVATLADQITLTVTQTVSQVQAGASVTGVQIERLDLGALGDELSFDRLVREPLQKLYANGYTQSILVLVDALDESLTYTGHITLARLLARLADLPQVVRLLVSTRPDPRVLKEYRSVKSLDLLKDAPASVDDVRRYAEERLTPLPAGDQASLAERISRAAEGNFLYAHLVLNDLPARQAGSSDLLTLPLPQGLSGLYHDFLNRELGEAEDRWYNTFKPLLGLIAVAQGWGLSRSQLEEITGQNVEQPLRVCRQYLDGELPNGPFRPFHKSFADFLLTDPANSDYRIIAAEMHQQLADHYWQTYAGNWGDCDAYGLRYLTTHGAEAALVASQLKRHQRTARLVKLVLETAFQQAYLATLDDLFALQQDLERTLNLAAANPHSQAPALVVEVASGLLAFRQQQLQPGPIFELAQAGQLEAAERRLALFPAASLWQQLALLAIAWLAAPTNPDAARKLRDRLKDNPKAARALPEPLQDDMVTHDALDRLLAYVNAALDGTPPPIYSLPAPPPPWVVQELVTQMGGVSLREGFLGESGLDLTMNPNQAATSIGGSSGSEELLFAAKRDGPFLVAYAAAQPEEGDVLFRQYSLLHAANNYLYYRNRSLAFLLEAALSHPNPIWIQARLPELIGAALSGSKVEFQASLPLTVLALQGIAGQSNAAQRLEEQRMQAQTEASGLQPEWERNDSWGSHQRRLAALAEIYALVLHRPNEATDLLNQALDLPYGFAGFQVPVSLTVAEAIRICLPTEEAMLVQALQKAHDSAHNIQDVLFCLQTTARFNALKLRWWIGSTSGFDVMAASKRLAEAVDATEFTALHRVGERFEHRRPGPNRVPLPLPVYNAKTLAQIAEIYTLPPLVLQSANPEFELDTFLPSDTLVNIPDPQLAPLLAARFAAEILISPTLSTLQQVQLIQLLVPIAIANPTALDTVLSRLLLAAQPTDTGVLAELAAITGSYLP